MSSEHIAEDLRDEYEVISAVLEAGVDDPWAARCRTHIEARSRAEARVAELEAEKQKAAQEWLHLDAANRVLIDENKRLRKCADAMADAISAARFAGTATPMCEAAYEAWVAAFPREEAKPMPKHTEEEMQDNLDDICTPIIVEPDEEAKHG